MFKSPHDLLDKGLVDMPSVMSPRQEVAPSMLLPGKQAGDGFLTLPNIL